MSRFDEERRQGEVAMRLLGEINQKDREVERLRAALDGLLTHYVDLVNCGDCGFWDPEKEPEVIAARTALEGNDTTSDREGET